MNRILRPISLLAATLGLVLAGLFGTGCQPPLLSPDDERSPYARYDSVRGQAPPQYVIDEFGRRRPNLRERLMPRD